MINKPVTSKKALISMLLTLFLFTHKGEGGHHSYIYFGNTRFFFEKVIPENLAVRMKF